MIDLITRASHHPKYPAIRSGGKTYDFQQVLDVSYDIAKILLGEANDLNETRVAFMVAPGFDYVTVQWGIWRAGGIAVPLCTSHPLPSLQYVIEDSDSSIVIIGDEYLLVLNAWVTEKGRQLISLPVTYITSEALKILPDIHQDRRAMILYTSGTTNLPKGVVTTHANITAQITALITSWAWGPSDHILCVLPLHHVHGIINVVSCALWIGATVEFLPLFTPEAVFRTMLEGRINVFMAVPTIYYKLIVYWESVSQDKQKQITTALSAFRLMVSGSAALPESVMNKWKTISGHTLLERYGMTEIGMGISNPYFGERKTGFIGKPLPSVLIRLTDENNVIVSAELPGEIQVKGNNVFLEYWRKPMETTTAFTSDGWFKTGDIAILENGNYKMLGRESIDIIKSGGYKISALEIEEALREYPGIKDCSVIGLKNEEWGEVVTAVLIQQGDDLNLDQLNQWLRSKLPTYKCPRRYKIVEDLPRNAMGKVTKNDLKELF